MFGANYFSSTYFGQDYFNRTFAEVISVSLSDSFSLTDNVVNDYYPGIERTLIELMGTTDELSQSSSFARLLTESMGVSDLVSRTIDFIRALADDEGFTDAVSKSSSTLRALTDSLGITDSLTKMFRQGNITISPASITITKPSGVSVTIQTKSTASIITPLIEGLLIR